MKLLIQVAADAAWNYDLVIHSRFSHVCIFKENWDMKFNQIQSGRTGHLIKWNTKITTYRDVYTWDDSQRQFWAQHSVAMFEQWLFVATIQNNVATMLQCCAVLKIIIANHPV